MEGSSKLSRDFKDLKYMEGFGNHFSTEALEGSLPKGQNNPQKCPHGLYAEQLSGTAFTASRHNNQRSWLYKIKPSANHKPFVKNETFNKYVKNDYNDNKNLIITPNQTRWRPLPEPTEKKTFLQGLISVGGAGDPAMRHGMAIYLYSANESMKNEAFYNSDGDLLIVPEKGTLFITTEFGKMEVLNQEICVIQRGMKFSVDLEGWSRGYVCEIFKGHFKLPDLGPIGANGLANPRDFQTPVAFYEKVNEPYKLINKFCGEFFEAEQDHSPFDVVAWHGNYAPYKYNLKNFCVIGSISFDHPDPSIFTVLTCPTDEPGVAVCDFVIFPPRYLVQENTFRPPYYHRNLMSEYMGNVFGAYDAKAQGFGPGCSSLHLPMSAHGPDADVFEKASNAPLEPHKLKDTMSFMFETTYTLKTTTFVMDEIKLVDEDYWMCWSKLADNFKPAKSLDV